MPITVIATDYGSVALEALKDVMRQVKADDPMSPVTVLAPNNLAGITARRALAVGTAGRPGIAGIEVTTIPRLAERVAGPLLGQRRPATSPIVAAALRSALATSDGPFADVADHPATVRALAASHSELRDVSSEALTAVEQASPVAAAVIDLHRQVVGSLHRAWYDPTDVLEAATDHRVSARLGTCVLYLPQRLSRHEVDFVRALADITDLVIIAAFTGVAGADAVISETLDQLGTAVDPATQIRNADKIMTASDSDDEVRSIVREVVSALSTTPPERVAVLYTEPSPYARLLHEQLKAADIAVNGVGTRPVAERGVARFLLELLALVEGDLPRAALFQALANIPARDFTGRRIPLSRWERISRSAGVVTGDDWSSRLAAYIADRQAAVDQEPADDPNEARIERFKRDADEAGKLRGFATHLRQELSIGSRLSTWSALSRWCSELFNTLMTDDKTMGRLPAEEQYATATVSSLLGALEGLDELERTADLGTLRDVLDTELSRALPRVGRFGEGIYVGPLSSAIGLDLDVIYVLGMSEDLYPGRLRIDPLLPDSARAAADGELRRQSDQVNEQHRHFLAALAAGRRSIVSFPRGDLRRSSRRLPSRFLLDSLRELSGDDQLTATEWEKINYRQGMESSHSFAGSLLSTKLLSTEQEWRTRAAASPVGLDDDVVRLSVELIKSHAGSALTRYDGNLSGVAGLPEYSKEQLISPTALEAYAACPHAFFIGRLLGIQPLEQPEDIIVISALQIGNLIHESVDELVKEFDADLPGYGEPWSAHQHRRLIELATAKADDFSRRGLTGHPRLWEAEKHRIIRDIENLLREDDSWRAENSARVAASELAFGLNGQPSVEVPINEGTLRMRGSADKIDIGQDGTIYVTDLKTGSARTYKEISQFDPFVNGTKLQLPVYGFAARNRFGDQHTPVRAAYWFVRREPKTRIGIDLTSEIEETYAQTLSVIVRSIAAGLFPAKAPDQPDYAFVQCPYCNPDGIGHQDVRRRWERQRHDPSVRELLELIEPDTVAGGTR